MQVVLLAAGNSTRFYPLSQYGHKSFLPVMDKPIIYHTLESIWKTGIKDVIIVVQNKEFVQNLLKNFPELDLAYTFVEQPEALGMGDALTKVRKYIHGDFFLMHAHRVEFDSFKTLLENEKKDPEQVVLLAKQEELIEKYGALRVDGKRVLEIVEKPISEQAPSHLRVVGLYLLPQTFFAQLDQTPMHHDNLEEAISQYAQQLPVTYVETNATTVSLKYPWDLFTISDYLFSKQKAFTAADAQVSEHALVSGDVYIESGAKVMEGACIKGKCYIGKNAVVGNNAIVRDGTVLSEECVAGANMEIKHSLLLPHTKTHFGFIGDSIIGKDSHIAGGICTGNVRLDRKPVKVFVKGEKITSGLRDLGMITGDNVHTGVHVSTMPGVMIGNSSVVGPNTVIMENIADKTKFYSTFKNTVTTIIE